MTAAHSRTTADTALRDDLAGDVVPRWEWRTFDYQPQRWQDVLRNGVRSNAGSLRSETYLLTPQTEFNVMLRDERVEVKQRLAVDASGLELWKPILKARFPLAPDVLEELCGIWGCLDSTTYPPQATSEHLLSFLAHHAPSVRIVPARKWRRSYRIHGCVAERATVLAGGALMETLSLEHEHRDTLLAALRALRLERERNTSYVIALKQALGWIGESTQSGVPIA